jgi:pseudouridine-5'-phosphate glycosidase
MRADGASLIDWHPDVAAALAAGRPVVALESSVLAQGLPAPANREAAMRMTTAVRSAGAVPAVTAVAGGRLHVGLTDATLERFLTAGARKVSARDLGPAIAAGTDGSTTVAGTLAICAAAGLDVFATGGIGGVHRGAPYDESADLLELGRTSAVVVCAGAKSILDLPATLERLETHGVTVIGYRTNEFPGFFTPRTGLPVPSTADSAAEIARAFRAARAIGRPGAVLVVQPPLAEAALDGAIVERAVAAALAEADSAGVRGGAVTPFLLAAVERATAGRSLAANIALLESNARLAGEISAALAAGSR